MSTATALKPSYSLTPEEQLQFELIRGFAEGAVTRKSYEVVLASFFYGYRAAVVRLTLQALSPTVVGNSMRLIELMNKIGGALRPSAVKAVSPLIASEIKMIRSTQGLPPLSKRHLEMIGLEYAERIVGYFHETSGEAVRLGLDSLLSKKTPAPLATERAVKGFGLTKRQMNGYTRAKFDGPRESAIPAAKDAERSEYLARAMSQRVDQMAKQEAYVVTQSGKNLSWMADVASGKLDKKFKRVWITAEDELVCPACGPMHNKAVPVTKPFVTPTGQRLWFPGGHPNCRCTMRLIRPEEKVSKAAAYNAPWLGAGQTVNRDEGRFAPKVKSREPERLSQAQRDMVQALLSGGVVEPTPEKITARPQISEKVSLNAKVSAKQKISAPDQKVRSQAAITRPTVSRLDMKVSRAEQLKSNKELVKLSRDVSNQKISSVADKITRAIKPAPTYNQHMANTFYLENKGSAPAAYAVLDPSQLEYQHGEVIGAQLIYGGDRGSAMSTEWETDLDGIEDRLRGYRNERVNQVYSDIAESGASYFFVEDEETGEDISFEIPLDVIETVISLYAADELDDELWFELETNEGAVARVTAVELTNWFGLEPEDFAMRVFEINEAWEDDYDIQVYRGREYYRFGGNFRAEKVERLDDLPGVEHWRLYPMD